MYILNLVFFLIIRRPPTPTRPATLFPSTTLFRSLVGENQGQQSIERSRGRNIFQLKRINEIGRLQADDAKGQSAGLFGAEIQNSGLQRQFSPGKGPFAVLDPHLLSFEQLIVNDAARDLNARIDADRKSTRLNSSH